MVLDDLAEGRQEELEGGAVVRGAQVAVEGVEEPEGSVGGVVEPLVLALGEHVRDQAVLDVAREHPEDRAGLDVAAGGECEPLQRDHGVAAPVREPVVAGDDGPDLVAGGLGARQVLDATGGGDDELVGGEDELGGGAGAGGWRGGLEQPEPALVLGAGGLVRGEGEDGLPGLGGGDQGDGGDPTPNPSPARGGETCSVLLPPLRAGEGGWGGEVNREGAGAPDGAAGVVAALVLDAVPSVNGVASVEHQQAGGAIEGEPERRQLGRSSDLVVVADGGQDVRFGDRPIDAALVGSEVERWAQLQFDRAGAGQQLIGEVDGVLAVGQDDALLDLVPLGVVAPDREAELQAELGEVRDAGEAGGAFGGLAAAELDHAVVRQAKLLREMVEHDDPAERGRQGGDEHAVEAAGGDAGDGAGG